MAKIGIDAAAMAAAGLVQAEIAAAIAEGKAPPRTRVMERFRAIYGELRSRSFERVELD